MSTAISKPSFVDCYKQIKALYFFDPAKCKQIINKHFPIKSQAIEPLKILSVGSSSTKISNPTRQIEQQFYEQNFIPSPDLIISYQQTFIKSLRGQDPTPLPNHKLVNLYQKRPQVQSTAYVNRSNRVQEPITVPYRTLTSQYNYLPSMAENKRVFIEQREETILGQLKDKKIGLQMSLPVIEKSLIDYEIKSLESKNINLENYGKLQIWKSKRQQLASKLTKKQ